jgi:predicted aspartyl protease
VERLFSLDHLHTRALCVASLLALLSSAEARASSTVERDSLFTNRDKSAPPSVSQPSGTDADSSAPAATAAAPNLYSEAYWGAVSDLDLDGLKKAARSAAEFDFARGISLLASGDEAGAESAFIALGSTTGDFNVGVASQMMLAHTLLYERKWTMLRDLPANSALKSEDRKNTEELERWGHAFANLEPQGIEFPPGPVSIPVRATAAGTPAIRVKINGKEYEFWLDTGSSITVLSSEVAQAAAVSTVSGDSLTIRTFGGTARVRPALVRRMEIGGIVLTNTPAILMDASMMALSSASSHAGPTSHVDGIVGWDFIRRFDVLLDLGKGVVELARPEVLSTRPPTQNLMWIGQPLVEVRTSDGQRLHLALDTGAQGTLLNAAVLDRVRAVTTSTSSQVFGLAKTGASTSRIIPELVIEVGGTALRVQNVVVYGPQYSGLIGCDGILGSDLARFGPIHIDATNGIFSVGA